MLKPDHSSSFYENQDMHPTSTPLNPEEPKATPKAEIMIEMQEAHELHSFHGTKSQTGAREEATASAHAVPNARFVTKPSNIQQEIADPEKRPASTGPSQSTPKTEQEKDFETKSHPSGSPTTLSFLPSDFTMAQPFKYPSVNEQVYDTLDEPVRETLQRDLRAIWNKLTLVLHPKIQKSNTLKDWDLWGPLILCLSLAVSLSISSNAEESASVFTLIFVVVWCGSAVVTMNSKLLGGQISFFQSVCVLGYCIFPLVIGSLFALFFSSHLVRLLAIIPLLGWSVYAALGFLAESTSDKKRLLGVYPVFLFYFVISWVIVIC